MQNKFGKYDFNVEPFAEDITGRLAWGTLGTLILRAASLHAGANGFGYDDVHTKNHAWVLSRLVIDMENMPRINEDYTIETWVTKVYRQFTDRHFDILAPDGTPFGQATSIWALIDIESRQPADLTKLPDEGFKNIMIPEREIHIKGPSRLRLSKDAPLIDTHKAVYSDLDINGHVNSIRYIEMLLNTFSLDTLRTTPPRRIEVAYCLESLFGDQLDIYAEVQDGNAHVFEIRKGSDVILKAAITL